MNHTASLTFLSPLGFIAIRGSESGISVVSFVEENIPAPPEVPSLLTDCKLQLQEYFSGKRRTFDVPLRPEGTIFQQSVWSNLQKIKYGDTLSYAQLAVKNGDIKSIRAVGAANGKNPIAVIIPCHRVVGADGKLVGYAGELWRKQWLLEHEEQIARGVLRLF